MTYINAIILLVCLSFSIIAQTAQTLTNKDIINLTTIGLPSNLIIAKIKKTAGKFDTSPTALKELKEAGVQNDVILAMIEGDAKPESKAEEKQKASATVEESAKPIDGQTEWKNDKKNPNRWESKHLIKTYDKFHSLTILRSKPDDVSAKVGKAESAVSMSATIVLEKNTKPTDVILIFSPQTVSFGGGSVAEAFRLKTGGKIFFKREAEVILLVGNVRTKLNFTDKAFPIDGAGNLQEIFAVVIPLPTFEKMISAQKWEMLIEDVEIDFTERMADRVRPRLQALQQEIKSLP